MCAFAWVGGANGQTLSLVCAWPNNPRCDTIVSVDERTGMVTSYNRNVPNEVFTVRGSVTANDIRWAYTVRGFHVQHRIDRIRGMLYSQNQHDVYDPMPCDKAEKVTPKF
jgi:hypothetical protein